MDYLENPRLIVDNPYASHHICNTLDIISMRLILLHIEFSIFLALELDYETIGVCGLSKSACETFVEIPQSSLGHGNYTSGEREAR